MKSDEEITGDPETSQGEVKAKSEVSLPKPLSPANSDSNISTTSFKHWHRHMQSEHVRLKRSSFTMWKCCIKACRPCRWFDSIDYHKKICKCCLEFKTFKTFGTLLLTAVFIYIFSYSVFEDEVLPGGTVFFLFVLFITAYITGYLISLIGLPPMLAHLAVGIMFENLPRDMLPHRDPHIVEETTEISEKILLVVALIRAGLLLDMSRIQHHVAFIFQLALLPFISEFITVLIVSHFMLKLPWNWSAIQGSFTSFVSLASVTSIMQKNKHAGYGEDKDMCTVLIAAAVLNVTFGLIFFAVTVTYTLPEGKHSHNFWQMLLLLFKEISLGLAVGIVSGFLISFFPDKRNTEAAALRILVIGIASIAIANIFYIFDMVAAAALGCLSMCVIATNMWEELGWHKDNNPVKYFYTVLYYFSQPVVLSLVGYTMNFKECDKQELGISVAVLVIGLAVRQVMTILTVIGKLYPTNYKEKIFICIAWLSKGTFQILLAGTVDYTLTERKKYINEITYEEFLHYVKVIKETAVMGILLTTPLVCLSLTFLSPVLLTRPRPSLDSITRRMSRRRTSIKYIGQ